LTAISTTRSIEGEVVLFHDHASFQPSDDAMEIDDMITEVKEGASEEPCLSVQVVSFFFFTV
jgi:hypothetical protein